MYYIFLAHALLRLVYLKKSKKRIQKLARTYLLVSLGPKVVQIGQVDETGYRLKENGFETSSFELYTDFHYVFAMYTEVR